MPLPPVTKRENIMANIQSTLETLDGPNLNYNFTPKKVLRTEKFDETYLDSANGEHFYLVIDGDEAISPQGSQTWDGHLEVFVMGFFRWEPSTEDPWSHEGSVAQTERNRMIGDMKKVLAADQSRGGYADNTDFGTCHVDMGEFRSWLYAELMMTIEYDWQEATP